jgi:four helix bundle protein
MRDFRKLQVWNKAHQLTLAIYRATRCYPTDERFGLTSQSRRAVASVPTNIAEGCGRYTTADFARFLDIASGSASELEYHLLLGLDLGYLKHHDYDALNSGVCEEKQMLSALLQRVRSDR